MYPVTVSHGFRLRNHRLDSIIKCQVRFIRRHTRFPRDSSTLRSNFRQNHDSYASIVYQPRTVGGISSAMGLAAPWLWVRSSARVSLESTHSPTFSERFAREGQKPDDRLNIVRALLERSRGSHPIDSAFQLIELRDKLTVSLAEAARLASTTKNESSPISRLPSEIFIRICELACPQMTHRSVFDVIALTHVCRCWRDVLISYPIIWSNIYVRCDSSEPLITTMLQRSRGIPLTVNIQYYSDNTLQFGCDCSIQPMWEDGDYCPHRSQQMLSLDLLEPSRAEIHTLNVRYLRGGSYNAGIMEDILKTPFFLKSLPNLESFHWSCRHYDGMVPPFKLPRKLFGSSLPHLQKLSMVNCWGLLLTDTPVLKVMSAKYTETSANQLVHSLRRWQSLTSLSFTNFHVFPGRGVTPCPVSMENLKELILRRVEREVISCYIRCPSIDTVTTLRIAPFTQNFLGVDQPVNVTATNGSGGSVSSLSNVTNCTSLKAAWDTFSPAFKHAVTTLEVEDLHLIVHGVTAITKLMDVLPDLCTIRVRLPPIAKGFEDLREILARGHGITRVERLVGETESPDEARRNAEGWKALSVEHKIRDFIA